MYFHYIGGGRNISFLINPFDSQSLSTLSFFRLLLGISILNLGYAPIHLLLSIFPTLFSKLSLLLRPSLRWAKVFHLWTRVGIYYEIFQWAQVVDVATSHNIFLMISNEVIILLRMLLDVLGSHLGDLRGSLNACDDLLLVFWTHHAQITLASFVRMVLTSFTNEWRGTCPLGLSFIGMY